MSGKRLRTAWLSLSLTEHMAGWIAEAPLNAEGKVNPAGAEIRGRGAGTTIEHDLTIVWDDGNSVLYKPSVDAKVHGTVIAPILSLERLQASGTFRLLVRDPTHVETWYMEYDLCLIDVTGENRYSLVGHKTISGTGTYQPWHFATSLPFHVTRMTSSDAARRKGDVSEAAGVLHLSVGDLVRMMVSIKAHGGRPYQRLSLAVRFVQHFVRILVGAYGGPLNEDKAFYRPSGNGGPASSLPAPDIHWCGGTRTSPTWNPPGAEVGEDAWLMLTRYAHPSEKSKRRKQIVMAHAFAMDASSYNTEIPDASLQTNLATYLFDHEYDVWLFDYSASIALPSAGKPSTLDEIAHDDWPIGVAKVLELSGADQVDVFAHCIGSATFLMAMLGGHLGDKVRKAVCSQAGIFLHTSRYGVIRSYLPIGPLLQMLDVRWLQPFQSETPGNVLADLALRLIPVPRGERCDLAICRWLNAVYAMSYRHAQLDDATHDALVDLIVRANVKALKHINLILQTGRLVDHEGIWNSYVDDSRAPYLANVPLLLLQGQDNYLFKPRGTFETREWLETRNQVGIYKRAVLVGYAHLDVILGRRADSDVFPMIWEFLDASESELQAIPHHRVISMS